MCWWWQGLVPMRHPFRHHLPWRWHCHASLNVAPMWLDPLVLDGAERLLQNGALPTALKPEAILTLGLPPMSKALRQALEDLPIGMLAETLQVKAQARTFGVNSWVVHLHPA